MFRALDDLVRMGYIERVNRTIKRKTLANSYRLKVPAKPVDDSGDNGVDEVVHNPVRHANVSRQPCHCGMPNDAQEACQCVTPSNRDTNYSNAGTHLHAITGGLGEMPE